MADRSPIEWTDATWNPVRGCTRVSEGCRNCYAEGVAARFSGPGQPFEGIADRSRRGSKWTGKLDIAWHLSEQPIAWRRPRRVFVNSMADFFHESLPDDDIAILYGIAVAAHHLRGHTFQILTKRPARMRELLQRDSFWDVVNGHAGALVMEHVNPHDRRSDDARATCRDDYGPGQPPPGIWLGASVEDQAAADARIPELLATPAALRFLSCEPLLGPVDLGHAKGLPIYREAAMVEVHPHSLDGLDTTFYRPGGGLIRHDGNMQPWLDWIIAGGESGPGARPMHPNWARSLRDQCAIAGVPFFFKQWGEWEIASDDNGRRNGYRGHCMPDTAERFTWLGLDGRTANPSANGLEEAYAMARVGKKAAGALLDGREHRAFPDPGTA